jgi:FkbM family methyltransferase
MDLARIPGLRRVVASKRRVEAKLAMLEAHTLELQRLQLDATKRLDTLAQDAHASTKRLDTLTRDSASLLAAGTATVAGIAEAAAGRTQLQSRVELMGEQLGSLVQGAPGAAELAPAPRHQHRNGELTQPAMDRLEASQPEEHALLQRLAQAGWRPSCVFDVGASNGAWSRPVAELFPQAAFHLFEPLAELHPPYREGLASLAARDHTSVTTHVVALDAAERRAHLAVSVDPVGSSLLVNGVSEFFPSAVPVHTRSLDGYRRQHQLPAPQLLKLDVQGLELRILEGAVETLREVQLLIVETWLAPGYGPATPLLHEIVGFLAPHGLLVSAFAGEYRDPNGRLFSKDLVFARRQALPAEVL